MIVSENGLVLTAGHVIENTNLRTFEIVLSSGRRVKAKPLGYNLNKDLGMAQLLEPGPWPHAKIDTEETTKRGDWVVSIGHSGGWELGRDASRANWPFPQDGKLTASNGCGFLSAAIPGGPLFNLEGNVIGIHSSIGDSVSENRHIPIELFIADWERLGKRAEVGQAGKPGK